jgi:uncharacterized protein (TIGR00369 family)
MNVALTPEEVNAFVAEVYPSSHADGTRCVELGRGMAVVKWPFDESTLRPGGYISGPRMFGLADSALWFATFTVIGLEAMAVTSEMSIRFLRPARNGNLLARANLNSVSTRRLVGTVELWVDGAADRLVAVAQGSYARP